MKPISACSKLYWLIFLGLFLSSSLAFAVDSTKIKGITSPKPNISYTIGSGNDIYIGTWYYGAPDKIIGTTKGFCATGFTPQLVISTFKTPDSDSIGGGCQLYGINAIAYYENGSGGYNIKANAHLRYPGSCADKGLYVSYTFLCVPN